MKIRELGIKAGMQKYPAHFGLCLKGISPLGKFMEIQPILLCWTFIYVAISFWKPNKSMQFIWNEDQQTQLRILKCNFVFKQNSKPFGRISFHMKRITFKWSAGSQAYKCRDDKNGKVSSHHYSFKCSDTLAVIHLIFISLKTPQTTAVYCISFSFMSRLVKKPRGQFQTKFVLYFSFFYVSNLVTVIRLKNTL